MGRLVIIPDGRGVGQDESRLALLGFASEYRRFDAGVSSGQPTKDTGSVSQVACAGDTNDSICTPFYVSRRRKLSRLYHRQRAVGLYRHSKSSHGALTHSTADGEPAATDKKVDPRNPLFPRVHYVGNDIGRPPRCLSVQVDTHRPTRPFPNRGGTYHFAGEPILSLGVLAGQAPTQQPTHHQHQNQNSHLAPPSVVCVDRCSNLGQLGQGDQAHA